MKKRIDFKIAYVILMIIFSLSLTGCALVPELSLTQEQSELIAEYAAGLLVKYQIGHEMGLAPVSAADLVVKEEVQDLDSASVEIESTEEIPEDEMENSENIEDLSENDAEGGVEIVSSSVPMGMAFGADGFDINYDRYEFTTVYPEEESEELVFSMQATPGMDLMVIHFQLTNTLAEANTCNFINGNVKVRAIVNNERIPAQATILDNDLLNFNSALEGNSSTDVVLVFEVDETLKDNISSINLSVNGSEGENLYKIF